MVNKPVQMHFVGIYYNLIYDTFQSVINYTRSAFSAEKESQIYFTAYTADVFFK